MKGINTTRVLLAGIAAGVVINLGEFITWGLLLDAAFSENMAAHNLVEPGWAMAAYLIGSFVLGVTLAFTYAAVRPRFSPGPSAAVMAGLILWIAAWVMPMVYTGSMGLGMGMGNTIVALVIAFIEVQAAAYVAGWLYRESDSSAPAM
jgi:hypothetical protein